MARWRGESCACEPVWSLPRSVIGFLRMLLLGFGFPGPARFALLADPVDQPPGKVDQRLARQEHGDCRDDSGRRERPRPDRIDRVLGKAGALLLRALPGILGEHLR